MIHKIAHEDQIDIWWDRVPNMPNNGNFFIYLDDEKIGKTNRTHYEFFDLQENREYEIRVELVDEKGRLVKILEEFKCRTNPKKRRIDVTKAPYFALGDGKTLNTQRIQRAIDDCKEGEAVYFPQGVYLTGALNVHSNMELYFEKEAVLQGSSRVQDYMPKRKSRFEGLEMMCYSSLINMGELDHERSYNCRNLILRGKGRICGGGKELRDNVIEVEKENLKHYIKELGEKIKEFETADTLPGRARPRLINISNTQNVVISGLVLENGPSWNVHMIYSDSVVTSRCRFNSIGVSNGDGWDPDSSTNCTIYACVFNTGDDCVAIKSGKNPEGNIINRPCENIRVFDCYSMNGHGYSIGSEMSGGISNVYFWDCDLRNTVFGIQIKGTKKRGGYVKNIEAYNCMAPCVMIWSVEYNDDGESAGVAPIFKNYRFEKMYLTGEIVVKCDEPPLCAPIKLIGFDDAEHSICDVIFRDVMIEHRKEKPLQSFEIKYVKSVTLDNVICD